MSLSSGFVVWKLEVSLVRSADGKLWLIAVVVCENIVSAEHALLVLADGTICERMDELLWDV